MISLLFSKMSLFKWDPVILPTWNMCFSKNVGFLVYYYFILYHSSPLSLSHSLSLNAYKLPDQYLFVVFSISVYLYLFTSGTFQLVFLRNCHLTASSLVCDKVVICCIILKSYDFDLENILLHSYSLFTAVCNCEDAWRTHFISKFSFENILISAFF